MRSFVQPAIACLTPLLLAGCGVTGDWPWQSREHLTAQRLNQRMAVALAPDVAAGRAAVQPLPNGTQVTFVDTASVPGGAAVADPREGSVRASVVEAMLDPALMRVAITDTSGLPDEQREARVKTMVDYLNTFGLGLIVVPSLPPQPTLRVAGPPPPPGLTVTIVVRCLSWPGIGYGNGQNKPACD